MIKILANEYGWKFDNIPPMQEELINDVIDYCSELAQKYIDKKEAKDEDIRFVGIGDFIKQNCR